MLGNPFPQARHYPGSAEADLSSPHAAHREVSAGKGPGHPQRVSTLDAAIPFWTRWNDVVSLVACPKPEKESVSRLEIKLFGVWSIFFYLLNYKTEAGLG